LYQGWFFQDGRLKDGLSELGVNFFVAARLNGPAEKLFFESVLKALTSREVAEICRKVSVGLASWANGLPKAKKAAFLVTVLPNWKSEMATAIGSDALRFIQREASRDPNWVDVAATLCS
jgi:hypothetical protein